MWVTGPKAADRCAVTVPRVTPPSGSTRSRAGHGGGAAAQDPLRSSALPVPGAHSPRGDRTHESQGGDYFWRRCPPEMRARGSVTARQVRTVSWELGRHLKARARGRLAGHWAVSRVGPQSVWEAWVQPRAAPGSSAGYSLPSSWPSPQDCQRWPPRGPAHLHLGAWVTSGWKSSDLILPDNTPSSPAPHPLSLCFPVFPFEQNWRKQMQWQGLVGLRPDPLTRPQGHPWPLRLRACPWSSQRPSCCGTSA